MWPFDLALVKRVMVYIRFTNELRQKSLATLLTSASLRVSFKHGTMSTVFSSRLHNRGVVASMINLFQSILGQPRVPLTLFIKSSMLSLKSGLSVGVAGTKQVTAFAEDGSGKKAYSL